MRHKLCYCTLVLIAVLLANAVTPVGATPYASNVSVTGTTVNFILNEPSDILTYSLNGGAPVALDGTTMGAKMFTLGASTDKFSIVAEKNAAQGFTIGNGATVAANVNASSLDSNGAYGVIISGEDNPLTRFNSPRGVYVSKNPNAPNFGTAYISNSATGTAGTPARNLGDGMYALRADQSDAYGFVDMAAQEAVFGAVTTANTPFHPFVAGDGSVYVAGFGDALSGVFRMPHDMSTVENVLEGTSGPTALPAGQNHGSVTKAYVTGTPGNNLTVWTLDEDLNTLHVTGAGDAADTNSLWRYDIGNNSLPYNQMPTRIANPFPAVNTFGQTMDLEVGADGKFYMSDFRSAGSEAGIAVADTDGTILFDSLTATQAIDPLATDIYRNLVGGNAVSPDQKWMASMYNNGQIAITPLINGIPDVANRRTVEIAETAVNSSRGIAFDAAGNIHYVSSGLARYRVLTPGGHTVTTLTWDGTTYTFDSETIAPPAGLLGDFNDDDKVDAADYVTWRDNEVANAALPNDNGLTTQADRYSLWTANFGTSSPGSGSSTLFAAVPEPGSLLLMLAGLLALSGYRNR